MRKLLAAALALAATLALPARTEAGAVRTGFDSTILPANDDGSTGAVAMGFTVNFFGNSRSTLFVNNNGNITFDSPLGTFTPFPITTTNREILAPFFADVDTRPVGSDVVRYGSGTVDGRTAFGVSWRNVGYFSNNVDKLNTFQLVIIDRSDRGAGDFDFEFNYDQIQWETGDASGGSGGLGGFSARAGYANGSGLPGTFLELTGSAVNGALLDSGPNALIASSLNSNELGRYLFTVINGVVQPVVPVPPTVVLMGLGAIGVAGNSWRQRRRAATA